MKKKQLNLPYLLSKMNHMKKIIPIVFAVVLFGCTDKSASLSSQLSDGDYETLENLITVLAPKAYDEQDTASLSRILHEKFQLTDDEGSKFSKADEMEYVAKYGPSYDSFEYEVKRLEMYDNGTAVISGEGTLKGINIQGQAYITTYQTTDVLIKENGSWSVISSHVSGVKEEVYENAPN